MKINKKQIELDYKKLFSKIREILNRIDPEEFSPGEQNGAPIDEYEDEVTQILNYVLHNQEEIKKNKEVLINEITKIWAERFGTGCKDINVIVSDLLNVIF